MTLTAGDRLLFRAASHARRGHVVGWGRTVTGGVRWSTTGERSSGRRGVPQRAVRLGNRLVNTETSDAPRSTLMENTAAATAFEAGLEVISAVEPAIAEAIAGSWPTSGGSSS